MSADPRVRKTKIVATVGPACDEVTTLTGMIEAGMNVARLNLSHGSSRGHHESVDRVREAARRAGTEVAIMLDTRGIEIRTGAMASDVVLDRGEMFTLFGDGRTGDGNGVAISYPGLYREVETGQKVLLDDGAIELEVVDTGSGQVRCRVVHGGGLGAHKSVNLPDTTLAISAEDPEVFARLRTELEFAASHDIDYIAASFVQAPEEVRGIRELLADLGANLPIIAKIENNAGVGNLDDIVAEADGLMVARGDLGVELPLGDVPGTQKRMIRTTVMNGKPVITATQMLASMEHEPKPTRAEASDVANAILDGTSAVMLSGETAVGQYPVEAVATMASLALRAEAYLTEYGHLQMILPHPSNVVTESVSHAAAQMAKDLDARAIFSLTSTGFTSRLVSKHRPECPIIAITGDLHVARRLSMNWGVVPMLYTEKLSDSARVEFGIARARATGHVGPGDLVVVTSGHHEQAGSTDMIRVIEVGGDGG